MLPKPKREKQQNQINITGKSNLSPSLSADAGFRSWLLTCAITCKITEVQAEDYNLIDVFGAKCAKITHVRKASGYDESFRRLAANAYSKWYKRGNDE